jgi:hypothetical protein
MMDKLEDIAITLEKKLNKHNVAGKTILKIKYVISHSKTK